MDGADQRYLRTAAALSTIDQAGCHFCIQTGTALLDYPQQRAEGDTCFFDNAMNVRHSATVNDTN